MHLSFTSAIHDERPLLGRVRQPLAGTSAPLTERMLRGDVMGDETFGAWVGRAQR